MFPLYTEQDPDNPKKLRYKADSTFAEYLPNLEFSEKDKVVFNYLISNAPNTPSFEKDAGRLFNKLKIMAAERGALIENGNNKPSYVIGAKTIHKQVNRKEVDKVVEKLLSIISNKKWMDITYKSMHSGKTIPYQNIFPIVLFVWNGDSYAYVINNSGALRMLAIERFVSIDRIYDGAKPERKYDIESLLFDPFGIMYDTEPFTVKLKLSKIESEYEKQKEWPDCVSFEDCPDGDSIMTATTHSLFECKRWILARVPRVKVLEPAWLKEEIMESVKEYIQ